ncbi:CRLF3 factor [Vespula squamosa]|uniref:CRLF3 factor n=1 Tax=Vespula squamosa TaxID=30214 RepID=A0ABD2C7Q1_VESSQ
MSNKIVRKDKYTEKDLQKVGYEIKPDIMLVTRNKMLPTFKSISSKMSQRICSFPNVKPTMMKLSKHKKKPTLSFLQSPSHHFHKNIQEKRKVRHPTCNKSYKTLDEKSISHNKLDSQKNYISSTSEQSYKSRRLTTENENKSLLFPNTSSGKYYSQEKMINSDRKSFPISTLALCSDARRKQKALKRKDQSSAEKNILLCKNKNTLHRTNIFMPIAQNIFQDTEETNINCINYITSNLNHTENKYRPKTVGLTFSKMKTTNNEDLLIAPMYQSFFCNLITPELCNNGNRKEDINMKNKLYTSYSEHMMKIVNYNSETRLLHMYHPKICYLCCSTEKKNNIKRSISAIRYSKSTQCVFDIKNNNSYLHISQSKHNNLNDNQQYNVQCSFEDINCISMPEKSSCLIKTCKAKENKQYMEAECNCKIKYSWQIIGTSSQTSKVLLHNVLEENQNQFSDHNNKPSTYKCEVKYSWQIVGTETQVALQNSNDTDYWTGVIFSPNIHRNKKTVIDEKKKNTYNDIGLCELQACRKKCIILNNQCIQTLAEKKTQTDILDCKVKYSWQDLILQHL